MEQYSIYEGHMADLMKKITRIQNKCRKYGCEFHFAEIGEEFGSDETEEEDSYYYTASDVEEDFDDSDI